MKKMDKELFDNIAGGTGGQKGKIGGEECTAYCDNINCPNYQINVTVKKTANPTCQSCGKPLLKVLE